MRDAVMMLVVFGVPVVIFYALLGRFIQRI